MSDAADAEDEAAEGESEAVDLLEAIAVLEEHGVAPSPDIADPGETLSLTYSGARKVYRELCETGDPGLVAEAEKLRWSGQVDMIDKARTLSRKHLDCRDPRRL